MSGTDPQEQPIYKPGDVANNHMLDRDGVTWRPLAPPSGWTPQAPPPPQVVTSDTVASGVVKAVLIWLRSHCPSASSSSWYNRPTKITAMPA